MIDNDLDEMFNSLPDEIELDSHEKSANEIKENRDENKREYIARLKYSNIVCSKAKSFKDIVGIETEKNIQYRIVTSMSFNAVTVIQHIYTYFKVDEIFIAVFRMNNKSFDFLKEIIIADNVDATFMISVYFANNKHYERWTYDLKEISKNNKKVKVGFGNIHAKVFLCKTECGKHIVFEGSGNLSHNEAIEQYIYEDNKQTYNFHKEWITKEIK